jgi:hypothetical protein
MKMRFGKYADSDIEKVPEDYLLWLLTTQNELKERIETELARRAALAEADLSWMERIVKAGFRELSKRHHPDLGGDVADMKEINAAYAALRHKVKSKRHG